jgi:glycosyltransferase involved in cell wall biosynthesis
MEDRKKILWLPGWYPNRKDRFEGDFIQRHARAAALYHDVHVLYVTDMDMEHYSEEELQEATGLTEQVIYFHSGKGFWGKVQKQFTWRKLYRRAIEQYVRRFGAPDLVHVHVSWKAGIIAMELKRKNGWPYLVTEHWGIYNNKVADNFFRQPSYRRNIIKRIFVEAKELLTPSIFLGAGISSIVTRKAFHLLPNVVDTSLFFPREEKYATFTFLHVSNMVPLKNVSGILKAFNEIIVTGGITDVQLILAGDRDHTYRHEAEALGLLNRHVFFKGEISYRDVAREMQMAHCLVLNSTMENSPCVIGEALCCGLTVVAPAVGGIPELVDGSNGILFDPAEEKSLAMAMLKIMQQYHQYGTKLIAASAHQKFNYSAVGKIMDEAYRRIKNY